MGFLILRSAVSAAVSASNWDWDDKDPTHIADPTATSNGTGSELSPLQPSQAWALSAVSAEVRCKWKPGALSITGAAADVKRAFLAPLNSGTASRRIIHYATNKAANPAVLSADMTHFRRSSGTGVIFGFDNNDYCIFDGFNCDTASGAQIGNGSHGEVGQVSSWDSSNCKFVRLKLDSQFSDYDLGNHNNIFVEDCQEIEIADSDIGKIGSVNSPGGNVCALMWYNTSGMRVHHNLLHDAPTGIWCKAQTPDALDTVKDHDYHHNIIRDCGTGIQVSSPIQTTLAMAVRAYQNLIYDCMNGLVISSFNSNEPKGIVYANNTIWRLRRRGTADSHGTTGKGCKFLHAASDSFASGCLIVVRNNAFYDTQEAVYTHDNSAQYDNLSWDRNLYNTQDVFWRQGEGGPTASFATWQAESPARDTNGSTSAPGFEDIANDDARPAAGSALLGAGTDYLQLLGGTNTAPINIGAIILPGRNDQFGPRF